MIWSGFQQSNTSYPYIASNFIEDFESIIEKFSIITKAQASYLCSYGTQIFQINKNYCGSW